MTALQPTSKRSPVHLSPRPVSEIAKDHHEPPSTEMERRSLNVSRTASPWRSTQSTTQPLLKDTQGGRSRDVGLQKHRSPNEVVPTPPSTERSPSSPVVKIELPRSPPNPADLKVPCISSSPSSPSRPLALSVPAPQSPRVSSGAQGQSLKARPISPFDNPSTLRATNGTHNTGASPVRGKLRTPPPPVNRA